MLSDPVLKAHAGARLQSISIRSRAQQLTPIDTGQSPTAQRAWREITVTARAQGELRLIERRMKQEVTVENLSPFWAEAAAQPQAVLLVVRLCCGCWRVLSRPRDSNQDFDRLYVTNSVPSDIRSSLTFHTHTDGFCKYVTA